MANVRLEVETRVLSRKKLTHRCLKTWLKEFAARLNLIVESAWSKPVACTPCVIIFARGVLGYDIGGRPAFKQPERLLSGIFQITS